MKIQINEAEIAKFEDALLTAQQILLLTHRNPDGDAVGSLLALFLVLKRVGKSVTPACCDSIPANFHFLPKWEKVVSEFETKEFDLVIVLDCGDPHQTVGRRLGRREPRLCDRAPASRLRVHHAHANLSDRRQRAPAFGIPGRGLRIRIGPAPAQRARPRLFRLSRAATPRWRAGRRGHLSRREFLPRARSGARTWRPGSRPVRAHGRPTWRGEMEATI